LTVITIGRDDAGRFYVSLSGRTWVAESDESEQAFAARVQRAVGSAVFLLSESDGRL
jgi:hypothetical protein